MSHFTKTWKLFLILLVLSLAASISAQAQNIIYVRCGGYPQVRSINEAVALATPGSTIAVCGVQGVYVENVDVNKDGLKFVNIFGTPILFCRNTSGSGFDFHANNGTIQGFYISKCSSGISVEPSFGGEMIQSNTLTGNGNGVSLNSADGGNQITHNSISHNTNDGIFDYSPQGDTFSNNDIRSNGANGIEVSSTTGGCTAPCATVTQNLSTLNSNDGLYLNNASKILITKNYLLQNNNDGLEANTSVHNRIGQNQVNKNGVFGIEMHSNTANSLIDSNQMHNNVVHDGQDEGNPGPHNTWTNDDGDVCSPTTICT